MQDNSATMDATTNPMPAMGVAPVPEGVGQVEQLNSNKVVQNDEPSEEMTTRDLSERYKVKPLEAAGLINFLKARGKIFECGERSPASGKGKKSKIYRIPKSLTLSF